MSPSNIVTPWTFKDGREYVLSISVTEHPSNPQMSLKISDSITAEEWSCKYDSKFIETLTHRTGNFKPFHVFLSMIKSALLKKSESVALDLMNLTDLENLRAKKGSTITGDGLTTKDGLAASNGETTFATNDHSSVGNGIREECKNNESASSKKKYLIVTYVAEFDRVHYPIPLSYSGAPNHQIMQNSIFQLRSEISTLRNAKAELEEEVDVLRQSQGLNQPLPSANHVASNLKCANDPTYFNHRHFQNDNYVQEEKCGRGVVDFTRLKSRCPEDHVIISQLALRLSNLEGQLCAERSDYENKIEKLQAQNDFLRQKLEAADKYEEQLENEIYSFTNNKQSNHRSNVSDSKRRGNVRGRNVGNSGDAIPIGKTNLNKGGRIRSPVISPQPRRGRSFSPSPNRLPSFDPTAYVRDRKLRQEKMAQLRLEKVNAQIRMRESSPSSRSVLRDMSRSRSHSRESAELLRGRLRNSFSENNPIKSRIGISRSPIRSKGQHDLATLKKQKLGSSLYNQIEERLGRQRNRTRSRRSSPSPMLQSQQFLSDLRKSNKHILSVPLHTHVENLVRQEIPKLQHKQNAKKYSR